MNDVIVKDSLSCIKTVSSIKRPIAAFSSEETHSQPTVENTAESQLSL